MNKNIEERRIFAKENNLLKYQLNESNLIPRLLDYICITTNETKYSSDTLSIQIMNHLKKTYSDMLNKIQKERQEYKDKLSTEDKENKLIGKIFEHLTRIDCLEELNNVKVLFNSINFVKEFLERVMMENNKNVSIEDLTIDFEDKEIKIDLSSIDMKNISIYLTIIQNIVEKLKKENGRFVVNNIAKYEDTEKGKIQLGVLHAIGGIEERNTMITDIYNFVGHWKELNKGE